MKKEQDEIFNDQVEGRNSVIELLESGRDINKIYISDGEKHGSKIRISGSSFLFFASSNISSTSQYSNGGTIAITP